MKLKKHMVELKKCIKCERELATGCFYKYKNNRNHGLMSWCKECYKDYNKKWNEENRDKRRGYCKKWGEKNKDKRSEYMKKYNEENKNKTKEYRQKNAERRREQSKNWRQENTDHIKEYRQIPEVKEMGRLSQRKSRSLKKNLPSTLTYEQWEKCKEYFSSKCAYCGKEEGLHQEHFIPVSKNGGYTVNNIIPACQWCNFSKHNNSFFEWYPQQSFYSRQREKKILKYLNYTETREQQTVIFELEQAR